MRCSWAPSLVLLFASACDDSLNVGSAEVDVADASDGDVQSPSDAGVERIDRIADELKGDWVGSTPYLPGAVFNLNLAPNGPRSGAWLLRCTNSMGQSCRENGPAGGFARDAGSFPLPPFIGFLDQVFNADQMEGTYWVHAVNGSKAKGILVTAFEIGLGFEYEASRDIFGWLGADFTRVPPRGPAKP